MLSPRSHLPNCKPGTGLEVSREGCEEGECMCCCEGQSCSPGLGGVALPLHPWALAGSVEPAEVISPLHQQRGIFPARHVSCPRPLHKLAVQWSPSTQ